MKIKIVVEGKSDKIFISNLIKKLNIKKIDVQISGGKNKQEISNHKTIKKIIDSAKILNYDKVIIVIDKKTQFNNSFYDCVLDVKNDYQKKVLKNLAADVVVVDEEIECWFILGENVKNYYKNCYSEVKKLFNSTSQEQLAQRAVKKLDKILENRKKNRSFDYFLRKICV